MKKDKKHCDKCSYESEEGLVLSGYTYCGYHQSIEITTSGTDNPKFEHPTYPLE